MITAHRLKLVSFAVLMSGVTVVLSQQWLQTAVRKAADQARAEAPVRTTPTTRVLVAAAALPAGATIKPGALRWQDWPTGVATAAYLTQANTQLEQFNGAVVRSDISAGEPIVSGLLVQPRDGGVLAAVLKPGYRAVTINVTAASAVGGFVMPNDRVDLILSRDTTGGSAHPNFVSETLLGDLRVLGSDQRGGDAKKEVLAPQTVTLEVSPQGAEMIAVAEQLGKMSLSLRSLGTGAPEAERPRFTRIAAGETPSAAPRSAHRAAPAVAVEVVRGGPL